MDHWLHLGKILAIIMDNLHETFKNILHDFPCTKYEIANVNDQ